MINIVAIRQGAFLAAFLEKPCHHSPGAIAATISIAGSNILTIFLLLPGLLMLRSGLDRLGGPPPHPAIVTNYKGY